MDDLVERAAELVDTCGPTVVFTGAGVSTESGIPDFRSADGLWTRHDPADFSYQGFLRSEEGRRRYWAVGRALYTTIRRAEPNPAHHAIARLERLGLVACVITQNVDNLHRRAGTSPERLIELHGNATRARCLACARGYTRDEIQARLEAGEAVPACLACGGVVKPHTVLFGEPMPAREMALAEARSRGAGCLVVVGSSLAVYPAAYLPLYARESGARLIVVNLAPTHLDHLADVVISGRAGEVMARLVERLQARAVRRTHSTPSGAATPAWPRREDPCED